MRVDLLTPSWMIFGGGFRRDPMRRCLVARARPHREPGHGLLITLPVMLLTALAIKLEDGLAAHRCSTASRASACGGRSFNLLKFRSMRADAERDGRRAWAQKDDPRVTRVGALIRKLRIDELPQILNVLARSHELRRAAARSGREFVAELSGKIPYYVQRHTREAGHHRLGAALLSLRLLRARCAQKLQYDLYYIKNNSFLFDLAILLQTAEVVFMGKGAR